MSGGLTPGEASELRSREAQVPASLPLRASASERGFLLQPGLWALGLPGAEGCGKGVPNPQWWAVLPSIASLSGRLGGSLQRR